MPAVAALIAVPLPFKTPVMEVEMVSAGVAPPDEEPAKPFALATDTAVTVPVVGVVQCGARVVPCEVSTSPALPLASIAVVAAADW